MQVKKAHQETTITFHFGGHHPLARVNTIPYSQSHTHHKSKKLPPYLQHVKLIVLISLEAFGNSRHGARGFLPEVQQRGLIVGQHMGKHVTATGCQQVHLLHHIQLQLVKPLLRLANLGLNLMSTKLIRYKCTNM